MIRFVSAAAFLLATATLASADPQLERVRGIIDSATATSVTVKTGNGTQEVAFSPATKFVSVLKSSLDEVKDGKFIGTATKGDKPPVALELVIFPASMKGTGEGHYDWDSITDTTGAGKPMAKTSMTNGSIKSIGKPLTRSAMTNGTIKKGTSMGGTKMIEVTYNNGQTLEVKVPPTAPIVEFEPVDKSILKPGAHVFSNTIVGADGKLTARLVAVGKDGVTPPM